MRSRNDLLFLSGVFRSNPWKYNSSDLRSEPKILEFKYLMAQEKIDLQRELQKELNLMKETQPGFNFYLSLAVIQPC